MKKTTCWVCFKSYPATVHEVALKSCLFTADSKFGGLICNQGTNVPFKTDLSPKPTKVGVLSLTCSQNSTFQSKCQEDAQVGRVISAAKSQGDSERLQEWEDHRTCK